MGNSLVSSDQGNAMGGANSASGAQAENTFQNRNVKQLLVLVRYKPAPPPASPFGDMSAAGSMIGGVTGAIEGAVGAVEDAMASIPGLDMFIKEKKTSSPSEKEYAWDYSAWDSGLDLIKSNLKAINPENETDKFEFSSTDSAGRKKDAQQLLSQVKSKIAAWSKYTVWIHFVGLGQGGNVVNECTGLLAGDGQFGAEKWCVKSVICIGCSSYKNNHALNPAAFKGEGRAFYFGNGYDLTRHGINYFEPNDKLLAMIRDANKNTLSLAVGKIKLHIIKILSLVLGGLNLSISDQSDLKKFDLIKAEVEGMIGDVLEMVKKIISDGTSFVKLGDIPDFSRISDGYANIPGECSDRIQKFISDFTDKLGDQAGSANISLGPKDLVNVLNCLCPLFDKIAASLSVFKYEEKAGSDLARQIIESAGIKKVFLPADQGEDDLSKYDPYHDKVAKKALKEDEADKASVFIKKIESLVASAAEKGEDVNALGDDQQKALAEALFCMVLPMLVSKQQVYNKLIDVVNGFISVESLTKNLTMNKLMDIPGDQLKNLQLDFPEDLKKSVNNTDGEISRIKGYFSKSDFSLQEDSMYFIYNAHNLVYKKIYDPVAFCIDSQTAFLDYQKAKGFSNEFMTSGINKYSQGTVQPKENVLPAQELPVAS